MLHGISLWNLIQSPNTMQSLAEAIQLNNSAIDCGVGNLTSEETLRKALGQIKTVLLINRNSSESNDYQSNDGRVGVDSSLAWIHPSCRPLKSVQGSGLPSSSTSLDDYEPLFSYQRPLYFHRDLLKQLALNQDASAQVLQFIPSVIMFNMALCLQYRSNVMTSTRTTVNGTASTGHQKRELSKAQSFYGSILRLISRDNIEDPAIRVPSCSELEVLVWNNMLQVSMELGDTETSHKAAVALYELSSGYWTVLEQSGAPESPLSSPPRFLLLDRHVLGRVRDNLVTWQLADIQNEAMSSRTGKSSSKPFWTGSNCAPAA